jgi:hypothetical protein
MVLRPDRKLLIGWPLARECLKARFQVFDEIQGTSGHWDGVSQVDPFEQYDGRGRVVAGYLKHKR